MICSTEADFNTCKSLQMEEKQCGLKLSEAAYMEEGEQYYCTSQSFRTKINLEIWI